MPRRKPKDFICSRYFENCADLDTPELFYILDQKWFKEHEAEIRKLDPTVVAQHGVFIVNDPKVRLLLALRFS
jgi:hypothetical protein